MDLLTKTLLNEGDTVLCEAPSFIGSLNTFRSYRAKLVGIPMEEDGIDTQKLEEALNTEKNVKYLYTIPNFQNPSGITMSLEKRKKVYELCREHNVIILEDNPYGDLRFAGEDVPSIKSLDTEGVVVYAGSFSKVISPGMRVLRHRPQGGPAKDGGVQAGRGCPLQHVGPDCLPPHYDRVRFRGPPGKPAGHLRRKSSILLEAMERYFKPLASPGATLRAACSPGAPCRRGGYAGVCQKGHGAQGVRGAGHRFPHRRERALPVLPHQLLHPPPTSSSPKASACWPKPMRK